MRTVLKLICCTTLLLAASAFKMQSASTPNASEHRSDLNVRITMPDGAVRSATLNGVGCAANICSRVSIKATTENGPVSLWLDSIAAIRDTTDHDALVISKNGTARRMSLITDFRVLYLSNKSRSSEKLDLSKIQSLEFLP
jgi:hypothetical protein